MAPRAYFTTLPSTHRNHPKNSLWDENILRGGANPQLKAATETIIETVIAPLPISKVHEKISYLLQQYRASDLSLDRPAASFSPGAILVAIEPGTRLWLENASTPYGLTSEPIVAVFVTYIKQMAAALKRQGLLRASEMPWTSEVILTAVLNIVAEERKNLEERTRDRGGFRRLRPRERLQEEEIQGDVEEGMW